MSIKGSPHPSSARDTADSGRVSLFHCLLNDDQTDTKKEIWGLFAYLAVQGWCGTRGRVSFCLARV